MNSNKRRSVQHEGRTSTELQPVTTAKKTKTGAPVAYHAHRCVRMVGTEAVTIGVDTLQDLRDAEELMAADPIRGQYISV